MSDEHKANDPANKEETSPKTNFQKHITGNLLIDAPPTSPREEAKKGPKVSIARKITEKLTAPAPPIEDEELLDC